LLDLCIKHEVGIRRRPVEIYEIDEAFFATKFGKNEEDLTLSPEGDALIDD
jgi:restriction system protein